MRLSNNAFPGRACRGDCGAARTVLGLLAALYRNSIYDRVVNLLTLTSISFPEFCRLYLDPVPFRKGGHISGHLECQYGSCLLRAIISDAAAGVDPDACRAGAYAAHDPSGNYQFTVEPLY